MRQEQGQTVLKREIERERDLDSQKNKNPQTDKLQDKKRTHLRTDTVYYKNCAVWMAV